MGEERYIKIAPGLHLAVSLRFPTAQAPEAMPGLVKYELDPEKHSDPKRIIFRQFYWPASAYIDSSHIELLVPPEGEKAERGELWFRKEQNHRVLFRRKGELQPFGFFFGSYYIHLRLDPAERIGAFSGNFNPLYIRTESLLTRKVRKQIDSATDEVTKYVDGIKGIHFYILNARWQNRMIEINLRELDPKDPDIPDDLKNLPKEIQIQEGVMYRMEVDHPE